MKQSFFVIFCSDKPNVLELRRKLRPEHRCYLREHGMALDVVLGGPTLESSENTMNGTLLVVRAYSEDEVREFLKHDPYVKAQLFSDVTIRPWVPGIAKEIVL